MFIKTVSTSLLLSTIVFFSSCSSDLFNQTPKCSESSVVDTLKSLLDSESRKVTIDVDMIRQTALDEQNGMRTCQINVDFVYSLDAKNVLLSSFQKAMTGSLESVSKNNKIIYTVVLGETGKKYIVSLKDN